MADIAIPLGIVYLLIGAFGVVENLLTAFLINGSKDMQNPTYSYIVQACVCDAVVLLAICIFAGLIILFPVLMTAIVFRISAYVITMGWYPGSVFTVLTAVTRWLQLEYPHKLKAYFTTRFIRMTIGVPYLLAACGGISFIVIQPVPFELYNFTYGWGFDRSTGPGEIMATTNIIFDFGCAILICGINARSCWYIRRTRLQVLNVPTQRNRQREIRLFIQCAITGTIYSFAVIDFYVVSALKDPGLAEYLIANFFWFFHHVQQPVVYMILNAALRQAFVEQLVLKWSCGHLAGGKRLVPNGDDHARSSDPGGSAVGRANKYSDVAPQSAE